MEEERERERSDGGDGSAPRKLIFVGGEKERKRERERVRSDELKTIQILLSTQTRQTQINPKPTLFGSVPSVKTGPDSFLYLSGCIIFVYVYVI